MQDASTLEFGPLYRFADWPIPKIPRIAAGVYTVWRKGWFVYVGMAGRRLTRETIAERQSQKGKPTGLRDRLASHASGRRSGDQFCVYICDRFVLPALSIEDVAAVGEGEVSLDKRTRAFIRGELTFRWVETADGRSAFSLEREIQRGMLGAGKPFLNPL